MSNYKLIFATTTTQGLTFMDAEFKAEDGMTEVYQNGQKTFAVPTSSVVAIERVPDPKPADVPEAVPAG